MIKTKIDAHEFLREMWYYEVFTFMDTDLEALSRYGLCFWEIEKTPEGFRVSRWIPDRGQDEERILDFDECVRFVLKHKKGINDQLCRDGFGSYDWEE